ncbi:uncharacterized protein LOC129972474 [Argiope bruennichi]|uniref:DUF4200 domain-containing protein n=1 Tax=Argiope bruennichi TaxID=94029 RepID=A0A8T0F831_ARGBR|nr:uncharacterized protein LOC129972474 [Argiope bruennichi]KAF8787011.1 hypothetical protein HNY73_008649 [Argiope bruennichi]
MKPIKKVGGKKQSSKADDKHAKSKSETETSSKDLTELEKELFSNKISDLEARLTRKQQLCALMEEEKQFFETEYENKKILKKESMALLNQTYQDFYLEFLILESELKRMEGITAEKTLKREETINRIQRIEELKEKELKLERKLQEAERNIDDISNLESKLHILEEQICNKNEHFEFQISNLNLDFKDFIKKLQDQLNTLVEGIIQDKSLKLYLLPFPYQALFESGMLGSTWFKSVLETCENLTRHNAEINKSIQQIKVISNKAKEASQNALSLIILSNEAKALARYLDQSLEIPEAKKQMLTKALQEYENEMRYLLQLNNLNFLLEQNIEQMTRKMKSLENVIKQQEMMESELETNYPLLQIIMQVKDVIIKEL